MYVSVLFYYFIIHIHYWILRYSFVINMQSSIVALVVTIKRITLTYLFQLYITCHDSTYACIYNVPKTFNQQTNVARSYEEVFEIRHQLMIYKHTERVSVLYISICTSRSHVNFQNYCCRVLVIWNDSSTKQKRSSCNKVVNAYQMYRDIIKTRLVAKQILLYKVLKGGI